MIWYVLCFLGGIVATLIFFAALHAKATFEDLDKGK
jgi:hypothetical protein